MEVAPKLKIDVSTALLVETTTVPVMVVSVKVVVSPFCPVVRLVFDKVNAFTLKFADVVEVMVDWLNVTPEASETVFTFLVVIVVEAQLFANTTEVGPMLELGTDPTSESSIPS